MIFISYQRSDDPVTPTLVRASLARRCRRDAAAFLDIASIPVGEPFEAVIRAALAECSAVLAMIGPHWDADRLRRPDDFVRLELLTARILGKTIVPVVHGGRALPEASDLPDELRFLLQLDARFLGRPPALADDIERLTDELAALVPRLSLGQLASANVHRSGSLDFRPPRTIPWLFADDTRQSTKQGRNTR